MGSRGRWNSSAWGRTGCGSEGEGPKAWIEPELDDPMGKAYVPDSMGWTSMSICARILPISPSSETTRASSPPDEDGIDGSTDLSYVREL